MGVESELESEAETPESLKQGQPGTSSESPDDDVINSEGPLLGGMRSSDTDLSDED